MTDTLLLAFIFLVAGIIAVPLAARLKLGSVLGYLLAGIAISPLLSLLQVDLDSIQQFSELGVVMMLFLVGLELKPQKLWEMKSRLAGLGGGQVVLTTLLVMGSAMLLGQPWRIALTIGMLFSLSSTAIVLQTLGEKGLMRSDGGQSSFAVLLAQDIIVIPMLALLPLLATPDLLAHLQQAFTSSGASHHSNLLGDFNAWQKTLITLAAIGSVILGGNFLVSPILRFIATAQLRELFTAAALMFVIGITLLMSAVGLSPALGTFLAGVVLARSPYRHELESNIEPFKGLLLGLFFMTVGAGINFHLLFSQFATILGLTVGLILIKVFILRLLSTVFHIRGANKWLFALGLAQAGEFGFVLLSFTVANGILPKAIADQLLLVVALSMLLTPMLFIIYDRLVAPRYLTDHPAGKHEDIPDSNKIIIAGSGRVGSQIDRVIRLAGYDSTVIDFSVKRLKALQRFGVKNYFGDATRPELLEAAGIKDATILIVAIDNPEQISKLVKYVIGTYPHVHIISRAFDRHHVYDLWSYGCRDIVRENYDSSLRMSRSVLETLGSSRQQAEEIIELYNKHDQMAMVSVADAHKTGVPAHENEAYIKRIRQYLDQQDPSLKAQMKDILNKEAH
ncbi:Glutathione-regulated potassium-efflux system protein KefC [Marinomonas spartinae]|uniref:Glutathione-regulated potassium-efflux system protein KefC n=1 Tax=Marinomonas spartinae TaxID=1792290 RepID=A0A1A8TRT7_9GAMM|nr:cation:proton antiporter [Marinomonas spartinae]SBS29720.1 Glutathione-regulated potassium-efflux system protein KefC [Marinomonas spartinae]SBS36868.1 Glutathione-regulated potassium-efflux system protein KefC [Marinomonas spartinae]